MVRLMLVNVVKTRRRLKSISSSLLSLEHLPFITYYHQLLYIVFIIILVMIRYSTRRFLLEPKENIDKKKKAKHEIFTKPYELKNEQINAKLKSIRRYYVFKNYCYQRVYRIKNKRSYFKK